MASSFDPARLIDDLQKKHQFLPEQTLKEVCRRVKALLLEESTVVPVQVRKPYVVIAGDIHGQFFDLLELFRKAGDSDLTRLTNQYVFLGDFVDRGFNSVETFQLLLLLKLCFPGQVTLLRGNHESRQITQVYGFYDECLRKYGNVNSWRFCVEIFDYLCIAAVVENKIFCVHGGLAPDLLLIDQIRRIQRVCEIPHEGSFGDLVWSDPDPNVDGWSRNPRGAGWLFGPDPARQWNSINGMDIIARAHQLVQEGYKYMFERESFSAKLLEDLAPQIAKQDDALKATNATARKAKSDNFGGGTSTTGGEEPSRYRKKNDEFGDFPLDLDPFDLREGSSAATEAANAAVAESNNSSSPGESAQTNSSTNDKVEEEDSNWANFAEFDAFAGNDAFGNKASDDAFAAPPSTTAAFEEIDAALFPSPHQRLLADLAPAHALSKTRSNRTSRTSSDRGGISDAEYDLVTVWSAPNYCYRCGNIASVLMVDKYCNRRFEIFTEVEASSRATPPRNLVPYFL
ncbi:unnamed protein product [Amoebophrya sp. A25]|nr:unnamed protein product [Amoebophrya sp. A25]|eukprot:GSA25T00025738001.1